MAAKFARFWNRTNLAQKFALLSAAVLLAGALALGWLNSRVIEEGVTRTTGRTAALYINSIVAPEVQVLGKQDQLPATTIASLDHFLLETPLGRGVVSIKVWTVDCQVAYANHKPLIGKVFPPDEGLRGALNGDTIATLSELDEEENEFEKKLGVPLLEIYSPVRDAVSGKVVAVIEFYERAHELVTELHAAKIRSWRNVGIGTLLIFGLLFGLVSGGSKTISVQRALLESRVDQLSELLESNRELNQRVRAAANRATELNEQFLRRIGSDLHDGPAQGIGFALLRIEAVHKALSSAAADGSHSQDVEKIRMSLKDALKEIRDLCGGMVLPELDGLSLPQSIRRAIRAHESKSETRVALELDKIPDAASMPLKINVYRFIQEGLNNAFRHGGGRSQKVEVSGLNDELRVLVSDQGGGFETGSSQGNGRHMGLSGMRERVESFGGTYSLDAKWKGGVRVEGTFPLSNGGANHG